LERVRNKRIPAVALQHRIGETFAGVVTGVTPKGVFVRVLGPLAARVSRFCRVDPDCQPGFGLAKEVHQLAIHFVRVGPGYAVRPILHYQ
jgi:hypothetical protein